jgi:chromosome segregation ATPase
MKYENWLDSIQEPIINIRKILLEVYGANLNINLRDSKMMPNDIRETLLRAYDLLISFRNEITKRTREVYELRDEIKRLDELLHHEEYKGKESTQRIMELETTIGNYDRSPRRMVGSIKKGMYSPALDTGEGGLNEKIERLTLIVKTYKKELDQSKSTIDELLRQKKDLEEYNKKANEEILVLLETLKAEQEKQKQLSCDLEALTDELKIHRTIKSDNDY